MIRTKSISTIFVILNVFQNHINLIFDILDTPTIGEFKNMNVPIINLKSVFGTLRVQKHIQWIGEKTLGLELERLPLKEKNTSFSL